MTKKEKKETKIYLIYILRTSVIPELKNKIKEVTLYALHLDNCAQRDSKKFFNSSSFHFRGKVNEDFVDTKFRCNFHLDIKSQYRSSPSIIGPISFIQELHGFGLYPSPSMHSM